MSEHKTHQPVQVHLGYGAVCISDGTLDGTPALLFSDEGTGVIGEEVYSLGNDAEIPEDKLRVAITFDNLASLEVLQGHLNRVREDIERRRKNRVRDLVGRRKA